MSSFISAAQHGNLPDPRSKPREHLLVTVALSNNIQPISDRGKAEQTSPHTNISTTNTFKITDVGLEGLTEDVVE